MNTKYKVKMYGLILVSFILLLMCACQPTPNIEIIKQKNDGKLIESINKSNRVEINSKVGGQSYEYVHPDSWNDIIEIPDKSLNININAMIDVPKVDSFKVVAVEPMVIPIDVAKEIVNVATQGESLYSQMSANIRTKEMIETEIIEEQLFLANPTNSDLYNNRNKFPDEWQDYKKSIEKRIKLLQQEYQSAPSSNTFQLEKLEYHCPYLETDLELPQGYTKESWSELTLEERQKILYNQAPEVFSNYKCLQGFYYYNDQRGSLYIFNKMDQNEENLARFSTKHVQLPAIHIFGDQICSEDLSNLREIELTANEAEDIAIDAIKQMGIKDMGLVYKLATVKKQGKKVMDTARPQCYMFMFGKSINDVPTTYAFKKNNYSRNEAFDKWWPYEYIIVCVDDTGIINFEWNGPSKITEILTDRIELLEFSKIQDIFKRNIIIQNLYKEEGVQSLSVNIDEVKLGMMRIKSPDSPTGYMMIPVWDFFGEYVSKFKDKDSTFMPLNANNELITMQYGYSFLAINAIDGSIIDRSLGY